MKLAAGNNGGRYNTVHRQTDDGIVVSVAMGRNLTPLVFRYTDYLGCINETLIAGSFYPHRRLMRGDCGWVEENDSVDISFSWNAPETHVDGFVSGSNDEYDTLYHFEPNCAKNVLLDGLRGHRSVAYRKDREYWTPNTVLAGTAPDDPFAFPINLESNSCCTNGATYSIPTVEQWNPISCPPEEPDQCGINNYYDKCDKARKIKSNHCRLKGGEDAFGNPITTDL